MLYCRSNRSKTPLDEPETTVASMIAPQSSNGRPCCEQTHKKFVMRSRVEAREVTGKISALEMELDRLRGLQTSTEEQLRGRR